MNDFEKIYALYGNQVYKYLVSLTRDSMLAEELTQETFYQAIKSIHRFKGECKLSVWLCQIAKYSFYKYKRKHKQEEKELEQLSSIMMEYESPESISESNESSQSIKAAMSRLKDPYGEVVRLRTYGDLSFREIGDAMGYSENWARITFYRGKLKLKEILIQQERRNGNGDKL